MENLYDETIDILKENGKTEDDVVWFGEIFGIYNIENYRYPRDKFKEILNYNYDSGFGIPEISEFLYIVGKDWWLERHEYDGLEWWEYKTLPNKPTIIREV